MSFKCHSTQLRCVMAHSSNVLLDRRHPLALQLHPLSTPSILNQRDLMPSVFLLKYTQAIRPVPFEVALPPVISRVFNFKQRRRGGGEKKAPLAPDSEKNFSILCSVWFRRRVFGFSASSSLLRFRCGGELRSSTGSHLPSRGTFEQVI